jgi:hypothetical protein
MVGDPEPQETQMGDRAQIAIKQRNWTDGQDDSKVYLYSHWRGDGVYGSLQTVLSKRVRWDDPEYLARMIFQTMMGNDYGELGFGIGTRKHGDIEHPIPVLDCSNATITWERGDFQGNEEYQDCSFEEFAQNGPKRTPKWDEIYRAGDDYIKG